MRLFFRKIFVHFFTQLFSNLAAQNPFSLSLRRNYDYTTDSGWQNILSWYDKNARTGYLQENVSNGRVTLFLRNERGDVNINGKSIATIAEDIDYLKNARTWKNIFSTQEDGTHEIPALSGTEALLVYGYVYRIESTMLMPMDIFASATGGTGNKILFSGLEITVPDNAHIKVSGLSNSYLLRVFVR